MSKLSKRERVDAALAGQALDRVPVSAWHHFIPEERQVDSLAQVSLKHFYDFDWDWLKLNPRATYYAEAWGNRYDYTRYDSVLPAFVEGPINKPDDLVKIGQVNATRGVFAEQIDLVRQVRAGIGDAHFLQTVFSPLAVLAFLVARPSRHSVEAAVQAQYDGLHTYLRADPQGVHAALSSIAATLARYAAAVVDAGASGLFFAIVKLARQEVLSLAAYQEFGEPYDLQVLRAVQGAPFNLLHICGPHVYFDLAAGYPVHAVNWATLHQHNPTVGEARQRTRQALVGGVDELGVLQHGTPDQVRQEVHTAIEETGGIHFLLTPGCGASLNVPDANLHALRQAAAYTPLGEPQSTK